MAHYYYCLLYFAIILSKLSIAEGADEGENNQKILRIRAGLFGPNVQK